MPLTVVVGKLCLLLAGVNCSLSGRCELVARSSSKPMLWEGQEGGPSAWALVQGKNSRKPKLNRKERKHPEYLFSA